MPGDGRQRIDKWLWFARLTKTRTLAQKLALSGRVRINREKVEAVSQLVKPDDVITIAGDRGVRVLKVAAPGTRRGPAPEAQLLYQDLSPPQAPAEADAAVDRPPGTGRPTKRDRRAVDKLRTGDSDDFPLKHG